MARQRLRIPTELVVSLVGAAAAIGLVAGACNDGIPEPIDATRIPGVRHDAGPDARIRDALLADTSAPADAPPIDDAHPPDAPAL